MSDTLPEREDQIANEEADERTFQRIRRARLIGNPNANADWCDDCHGYTHMPWCPAYKSDKEVTCIHGYRLDEQCPSSNHRTGAHQPAARGGGDGEWSIKVHGNEIDADLLVNGSYVGTLHTDKAKQVLTEHNQHQSLVAEIDALKSDSLALVAEREALRRMLANVIDTNYGTSYHHIGDGDGMPAEQAKEIADWWKAELERIQREYDQQRSTSE